MNKLKLLIARCLMSAMYDREKDLHPQDAFGLSLRLIEKEKSVKNLIKHIENRFSFKSFVAGVLAGLMLALIFI